MIFINFNNLIGTYHLCNPFITTKSTTLLNAFSRSSVRMTECVFFLSLSLIVLSICWHSVNIPLFGTHAVHLLHWRCGTSIIFENIILSNIFDMTEQ